MENKIKIKKQFIAICLTVVVVISPLNGCDSSSDKNISHTPLSFTVTSDKESYSIDEKIVITRELKNISQETIRVNKVMAPGGNLHYELVNAEGECVMGDPPISYAWAHWTSAKDEYMVSLEPNQKITETSSLSLSSAGTYTLKTSLEVYVQSKTQKDKTERLGKLTSPAVAIQVLKKK
jgi:hypothetical protein